MSKDFEYLYRSLVINDYRANQSYGYLSELSVLTIKSILPSMTEVGNRIDYRRYTEEIKLWMMYRSGFNKSTFKLNNPDYNIYYGEKDNSIVARIIPLVIINKNWEILLDEVIKNTLFTTGNMESLFESIVMAEIYYSSYNNISDFKEKIKSTIINLSQNAFMDRYEKCYRLSPRNPKKFKIQFELEKIKLINLFNDIDINGYGVIKEAFDYFNNPDIVLNTMEVKILKTFEEREYQNIDKFYSSLSDYLIKIRNSRVNPDSLIIKDYILPNVFEYNKGETFFHSLLGDSLVVEKSLDSIQIKTKSGYYNLKK